MLVMYFQLLKNRIEELMELHRIDRLASGGPLEGWRFCRHKLDELRPEDLNPPALLDGHDLIALGHEPGPLLGRILTALEDAQLEQAISTREQALELVRDRFPPPHEAPP